MRTHHISFFVYENGYPIEEKKGKYLKKHELRNCIVKGIVRIEAEMFGSVVDDLRIKTTTEEEEI